MSEGVVVVEFKSAYGSAEVYRKIAQTRTGGYVMVPMLTPPDNVWTEGGTTTTTHHRQPPPEQCPSHESG